MAIQIELTLEEEAQLRQRAVARGTMPDVLATEFVRERLSPTTDGTDCDLLPVVDETGIFHPQRLEGVLDRCAQLSAGLPYLPAEALTREALYQDHD